MAFSIEAGVLKISMSLKQKTAFSELEAALREIADTLIERKNVHIDYCVETKQTEFFFIGRGLDSDDFLDFVRRRFALSPIMLKNYFLSDAAYFELLEDPAAKLPEFWLQSIEQVTDKNNLCYGPDSIEEKARIEDLRSKMNCTRGFACTFKTFIVEQRLGDLRLGARKSDVLNLLGVPESWLVRKHETRMETSSSWTFGSLSLNFDQECLSEVWISFLVDEYLPEFIVFTDFNFSGVATLADVEEFLSRVSVRYKVKENISVRKRKRKGKIEEIKRILPGNYVELEEYPNVRITIGSNGELLGASIVSLTPSSS